MRTSDCLRACSADAHHLINDARRIFVVQRDSWGAPMDAGLRAMLEHLVDVIDARVPPAHGLSGWWRMHIRPELARLL